MIIDIQMSKSRGIYRQVITHERYRPNTEGDQDPILPDIIATSIRDGMEEEFQRDKMIARQKSKGKRELLNLHSSINYGDDFIPVRRRKGKPHVK